MENEQHTDQDGSPSNDGPRLPYEIFPFIAQHLANERALRTVAHLNQTSRAVHGETLPALYETVDLEDVQAFIKSVGGQDVKGWKHCKYLFLNEITSHLLKQHLRFTHPDAEWPDDPDLALAFPKLIFARVLEPVETGFEGEKAFPASVEVHRLIPLDVLLDRCDRKVRQGDFSAEVRVSFFGVHLASRLPKRDRFRDDPMDVDIHQLTIKSAGRLVPFPEGRKRLKREGRLTALPGVREFSLVIEGDRFDKEMSVMMLGIIEYAKFIQAAELKASHSEPDIYFKLSCEPVILAAFTAFLEGRQPLVLHELNITLKGSNVTQKDVQIALEALADAYSPKWKHNEELQYHPFVEIQYESPVIPERYRAETRDVPDVTGMIHGQLMGGQSALAANLDRRRGGFRGASTGGEDWYGFHASIQEGYRVRRVWQEGTDVFARNYRCVHAPDPTSD